MKKLLITLLCLTFSNFALAGSVVTGVIEKSEVIASEVGEDGKPILGAAIGVGVGSLFGSGSGNTTAMIIGGIFGAKQQANKKKTVIYGWRYIVKSEDDLYAIDVWCKKPEEQCKGMAKGVEVYVVDGKSLMPKS
jgi:hypothetical protein